MLVCWEIRWQNTWINGKKDWTNGKREKNGKFRSSLSPSIPSSPLIVFTLIDLVVYRWTKVELTSTGYTPPHISSHRRREDENKQEKYIETFLKRRWDWTHRRRDKMRQQKRGEKPNRNRMKMTFDLVLVGLLFRLIHLISKWLLFTHFRHINFFSPSLLLRIHLSFDLIEVFVAHQL